MYWNLKEIEAAELANWFEQKNGAFKVLDVRQPAEIAAGIIPRAEAMPMHTIPLRLNELERNDNIVLVCRSGARSAQACMFLQQQGFENVFNLRGGMIAWAGSGQPIDLPQAV